jgi:hypothetical protein
MENILAALKPHIRASFYRTARGAEIDLILETGTERIAVEFKNSSAPRPKRGFWTAVTDLDITRSWVVAPIDSPFPLKDDVRAVSLHSFLAHPENRDLFA